jgi:2-hydroxy-3-keto-5-methylthiopentenyl-1-phosphate phosphatase
VKYAVVCDFDGTATLEDTADALSIAYIGQERWQQANDAFHAGSISFEQLLREIFEPIGASPAEVRRFALEHVRFRPGFEQLVRACKARGVRFVLASGGLDIYIRPALEMLPPDVAAGLELRANHAEHVPGGLALSFPYQHAPGACGACGSCKGAIVKELQAQGLVVVSVGDGNADRCMARVADVLFARGRLLTWCRQSGIEATPFETLDVVAHRVARPLRTAEV